LTILFLLILLIPALYVFVLLRPSSRRDFDRRLKTDYAHRGLHDSRIPENSLAAFQNAAEHGFGIELDVQLSRDGEVMVFHDYTLTRMTSDPRKVTDCTCAQLQALQLSGTGQAIPTLQEVLDTVDGRVPLLIELKGESINPALCPRVDRILSGYRGTYCVESFNPFLLAWYKKNRPDVIRGILSTRLCRDRKWSVLNLLLDLMALNVLARPDFIAFDHRYPERAAVKLCTKCYKACAFQWTIRTQDAYEAAHAAGSHTIFEGFLPKTDHIAAGDA